MCKLLFIGTQNEIDEIPQNTDDPNFYLEKISGEYLPIRKYFKNQHIYFAGTSRGCSCDFGIQSNKRNRTLLEQKPPIQHILNKLRKLIGNFNEWENRHQEKVNYAIEAQENYLKQTLKLLEIILNEIKKGNKVEAYCVWSGVYNSTPEFNDIIDTTKTNLRDNFEIAEKEFVTIV